MRMSEPLERRLRNLEAAVAGRGSLVEQHQHAAYQRMWDGTAVWNDYRFLFRGAIGQWRAELVSQLPVAVVTGTATRTSKCGTQPLGPALTVLTAPAGEALTPVQRAAVHDINTLWTGGDNLMTRIGWATNRLALGPNNGARLRSTCWRADGDATVLGEQVLEAADRLHVNHHLIGNVIGYPAISRVAGQIIKPETHARLAGHAERLDQYGPMRYLNVSMLEVAVLMDGSPEPTWFGAVGKAWWLGQNRSEPVNRLQSDCSIRELMGEEVLQRAAGYLLREAQEPTPWRTEAWYSQQGASRAGWEREQEYVLQVSRRIGSGAPFLPDREIGPSE